MKRFAFFLGACALWPTAAMAESGPVGDAGGIDGSVPHACACNDDCGAGQVCVDGTRGVRACCPGSALEDCPSEPGAGIECVDAGPPPEPDSGVLVPDSGSSPFDGGGSRSDAGGTPPVSPPEDDSCSASGSISHGASIGLALALAGLASRRRFRR